MITATTFATVILAYHAITLIWDLLDPDAVKVTFESGFRLLVAFAFVITMIVMSLVVLL